MIQGSAQKLKVVGWVFPLVLSSRHINCLVRSSMVGVLAYIKQCLVPTLKRGDIVVADNVPFHRVAGVEEAIQAAGASVFATCRSILRTLTLSSCCFIL